LGIFDTKIEVSALTKSLFKKIREHTHIFLHFKMIMALEEF